MPDAIYQAVIRHFYQESGTRRPALSVRAGKRHFSPDGTDFPIIDGYTAARHRALGALSKGMIGRNLSHFEDKRSPLRVWFTLFASSRE